ncbi:hypothetical protein AGOR_G00000390 [Albula goreensis]|uniref:PH domain-containing protein n=1 Tax=Albula goreensis TaxID=1534307 RepID=A0A8T3E3R0_9TELE|nr:hypothetical protein AGOR_G00000390 [Albula goreensis]
MSLARPGRRFAPTFCTPLGNHNQRVTAFRHPVTGQISPENVDFNLQEPPASRMSEPQPDQRPSSMVSESSTAVTSSTVDTTSGSKGSRSSGKVHSFGKRDQAIKRNLNVPVVVRGWLYKQDSSGMRLWKRKWFVLSDFCLFYYKDSREETVLGSIPLPSYVITPVEPEDHISRKYAFKACHTGMRSYIYNRTSVIGSQAEHGGMRTYFFSADTQEDMNGWVRAMNQAAMMQGPGPAREMETSEKSLEAEISEQQAGPQTNHINDCGISPSQPEGVAGLEAEPELADPRNAGGDQASGRSGGPGHPLSGLRTPLPCPLHLPAPTPTPAPGPAQRNGLPPEQNGTAGPRRGLVPLTSRSDAERQVQRKTALAQVEHWVKVQKGDSKSLPSAEGTLPRRTPPLQHKVGALEAYQSLPKTSRHPSGGSSPPRNLPSDYKYAHDRLSHFRMSMGEREASREGTVWRLYEWQQRQQYRHGSPTAPIFGDYADSAPFRVALEVPRSISVPPSPSDIPPPGPPSKALSPRRPHTPADRVTVRPADDPPAVEVPAATSPRRLRSQLSKSSHIERRSMPPIGYITHTVSAPSLHGKTADDSYIQLKKDLEYLDLKVTGRETLKDRSMKPLKIAESDVDVKLSRLCEQDKILQELESRMRTLKEDKDKLESVLDVSHHQMEQYRDQPAHAEKIAYQQRLLQEDLVHIRADISRVSTEMEKAWEEYSQLEMDLLQLRDALQDQMGRSVLSQQEKVLVQRELWRIEDVMAGLSSSKANYQVSINSIKNPERKLVPSVSMSSVPSLPASTSTGEARISSHSPIQTDPENYVSQHALQQQARVSPGPTLYKSVPNWVEDDAPPRPPLPQLYSPDELPPAVPPLPKEASVIRHTSVRGLKRQSDERKRDRETGHSLNGDYKTELRSCLSEPELLGLGGPPGTCQTLPSRGLTGSTSRLNQPSSVSSYVTLRRAVPASSLKERPKSALERLYSGDPPAQRGRMSAEEQLERMKRHQKALVRERKRTLSQGERHSTSSRASSYSLPASGSASGSAPRPLSTDLGSWRREQAFDWQLLDRIVQDRHSEGVERPRSQSDEWLTVQATPLRQLDMEALDYDLDLRRELSTPEKVLIPERYVDLEPEEISPEEREARQRKAQQIKCVLARSSVQNAPDAVDLSELDSALQEKERIISMSHALASEASQRSREVAARAVCQNAEVLSDHHDDDE